MSETKKYLDDTGLGQYDTKIKEYVDNTVSNAVSTKVDKVSGKGLSTNDYTTSEKTKLAGIEEGANKTVVDSALSATSTNPVQNKVLNEILLEVSNTFDEQQSQIDANKITVDSGLSSSSTNPVQNKVVNSALSGKVPTSRTVNGKALSSNITLSASDVGADASGTASSAVSTHNSSTTAHEDIRELITDVGSDLTSHTGNKSNPHGVTLSQLGVTATSTELNYVDGVTSNIQSQLDSKADEGHGHEIADVSGLQTALDGKAATSHGTHVSYSTTAPVMDGTASAGSASTVARSDHKHPTDTSRASQTDLTSHTSNTSNPHGVTKSQVGLGNVDNTADADKEVKSAVEDAGGNVINETYIKELSVSGKVITYTRGDDTTGTITTQDTNTTYTSLKNPYALTIQGNGTTLTNGTYDGSAAKTVNITPASIGAATSGHTHSTYAASSHTHDDRYYTESEVDAKFDAIIGEGASDTLDTIGEISAAITENQSVLDTLNSAIGNKANASDLSSHTDNTTVHITSTERTNWGAAYTHSQASHAPTNAEKNQNAFSNIVVGSSTIAADSATDSLTLAGSNVTLTADTTNDKVTIGITKANVTTALGYTPPTTNTDTKVTSVGNHYTPASDDEAALSADASSTTSATWNSTSLVTGVNLQRDAKGHVTGVTVDSIKMPANPNSNTTYSLSKSGSTITLTGSDGSTTSVTDSDTNTTYGVASSSTAGLVKIGYTESGKNYPVELNDSGQMYVNVPWSDTNTVYTHPSYTTRTGKPTGNQTPAFGGTATISQITSDATGHVTGATDRTITIPSTLSNGTGTAGLIKTSSTVTSASGYTACPVISGVPYYKDTNTTYSTASSSTLGLVKIGYTESGKNYPVELNDDGQMFVNVPWTDNNTVYTHPSYTSKTSGLYKITVDGTGHVSAATAVAKADITALGIPSTNTTYSVMGAATSSAAGTSGLVPAPAAGKQTSFLRGDGTWVVPTNTTYSAATTSAAGLMSASDKSKLDGITSSADSVSFSASLTSGTKVGTITINGTATDLYCQTNTNTTYSAGTGLSLSGTTFSLASSGATAGTYGAASSPSHGGTFAIPSFTVDAYGRVTKATTVNVTLPSDNNTDTKVTQTVRTTNGNFPLLLRGTSAGTTTTTTTTTFGTQFLANPSTGQLRVTSLNIGDGAVLAWDSDDSAITISFL